MTTQLPPLDNVITAYDKVKNVSYYTRDYIDQLVAEGVPEKNARNQAIQRAKSFVKEPEAIFQDVEEYLRKNPKFRLFGSNAGSYKNYLELYRQLVKEVANNQQRFARRTMGENLLESIKPFQNENRKRREAMKQLTRNLQNIRNRGAARRKQIKENYEAMRNRLYGSESNTNLNGNTVAPLTTRYQSPYNRTLMGMKAYSNRRITNAVRQKKRGGKTRKH